MAALCRREVLHLCAPRCSGVKDHGLERSASAAEHGVTKQVVLRLASRNVRAVGITRTLGHDDIALARLLDALAHAGEEHFLVEGLLGKDEDVDVTAQARRCGKPAGIAAHRLQDEHLLARYGIHVDVKPRLQRRRCDELGSRSETRAMVDVHQVVIDGLRAADKLLVRDAVLVGVLAEGRNRVHRIVAANVEQRLDVMLVHDRQQLLEVFDVVALQLVAARPERRRGRLLQDVVFFLAHVGQVDEAFGEDALDAVKAAVYVVVHGIHLVAFDYAGNGCVDD